MKLIFMYSLETSAPLTQNITATSDSRVTYYSSTAINYLGGKLQLQFIPRSNYPTRLDGVQDQSGGSLGRLKVIQVGQLLGGEGGGGGGGWGVVYCMTTPGWRKQRISTPLPYQRADLAENI